MSAPGSNVRKPAAIARSGRERHDLAERRAPERRHGVAPSPQQSAASVALAAPATGGPRAYGDALRALARDRADRVVFAVSALLVAFGYSLLLPLAYTQRVSFANWSYLDARYVAFSLAFALGFAWLITLQVHAVRLLARAAREQRGAGGLFAAVAAVISVLPSLLCCSPIVPTVVGLLGLSAGARLSTSARLQHFFATNENALLAGGLALLLASGLWALRKLARASCLAGECCAAPIAERDEGAHDAPFATERPIPAVGMTAGVTSGSPR